MLNRSLSRWTPGFRRGGEDAFSGRLVEVPASSMRHTEHGTPAFHFAVLSGDIKLLREFLSRPDLDVNCLDSNGHSAIWQLHYVPEDDCLDQDNHASASTSRVKPNVSNVLVIDDKNNRDAVFSTIASGILRNNNFCALDFPLSFWELDEPMDHSFGPYGYEPQREPSKADLEDSRWVDAAESMGAFPGSGSNRSRLLSKVGLDAKKLQSMVELNMSSSNEMMQDTISKSISLPPEAEFMMAHSRSDRTISFTLLDHICIGAFEFLPTRTFLESFMRHPKCNETFLNHGQRSALHHLLRAGGKLISARETRDKYGWTYEQFDPTSRSMVTKKETRAETVSAITSVGEAVEAFLSNPKFTNYLGHQDPLDDAHGVYYYDGEEDSVSCLETQNSITYAEKLRYPRSIIVKLKVKCDIETQLDSYELQEEIRGQMASERQVSEREKTGNNALVIHSFDIKVSDPEYIRRLNQAKVTQREVMLEANQTYGIRQKFWEEWCDFEKDERWQVVVDCLKQVRSEVQLSTGGAANKKRRTGTGASSRSSDSVPDSEGQAASAGGGGLASPGESGFREFAMLKVREALGI